MLGIYRTRKVEDTTPPQVSGGPIGTPLSERPIRPHHAVLLAGTYPRPDRPRDTWQPPMAGSSGRNLRLRLPLPGRKCTLGNEAARQSWSARFVAHVCGDVDQ